MPPTTFTVIDAGQARELPARLADGRVRLAPAAVKEALGWEFHDGLLCSDTMCVPVAQAAALETSDGIDLAALATALDRPLALDVEEGAAYLGTSARERGQDLASLLAPDFALPDLDGRLHALAAQRGKKVLLVAWASW